MRDQTLCSNKVVQTQRNVKRLKKIMFDRFLLFQVFEKTALCGHIHHCAVGASHFPPLAVQLFLEFSAYIKIVIYRKCYNYWHGEINNSRLHRHSK